MTNPNEKGKGHTIKLKYEKDSIEVLERESIVRLPKILMNDKHFLRVVNKFEHTTKSEKSWIWFQKSMLATLGKKDGFKNCDVNSALKSLEIIYAAYCSNENKNIFHFPINLSDHLKVDIA